jgi:hypothetical protein
MNCIHCGSTYYFCSQMCWEVAKRDTPWRILSDGFGPFTSPVRSTTYARYPRLPGRAIAHDPLTGWKYPWACCSNMDCKEVQSPVVLERKEGYVIQFTGEATKISG